MKPLDRLLKSLDWYEWLWHIKKPELVELFKQKQLQSRSNYKELNPKRKTIIGLLASCLNHLIPFVACERNLAGSSTSNWLPFSRIHFPDSKIKSKSRQWCWSEILASTWYSKIPHYVMLRYATLCIASDVILRYVKVCHVVTLAYAHVMLVYDRLYILLIDRMSLNWLPEKQTEITSRCLFYRMKDVGEDMLVDMSEILFNELAFFRLMQDLDGWDVENSLHSPAY